MTITDQRGAGEVAEGTQARICRCFGEECGVETGRLDVIGSGLAGRASEWIWHENWALLTSKRLLTIIHSMWDIKALN